MSRIATSGTNSSTRRIASSPSTAGPNGVAPEPKDDSERLRRVVVVVDEQDRRRPQRRPGRDRFDGRRPGRGRLGNRQGHGEACAAAGAFALDGDGAAVQLDQGAGDRQAQAAARPLQRLLALNEALEDMAGARRGCRRPGR